MESISFSISDSSISNAKWIELQTNPTSHQQITHQQWIGAVAGNSAAHGFADALLVAGHVMLQRLIYFGQRSLLAVVRLCKSKRWMNKACYTEMLCR
ncbi:hypothetical protein Nepgr_032229 [Nepenthes gracilis]|uniref:Uncharacterized protein n=1 Tax=Nepenthes gracilis TaxID=150966 RepID=A0AAD3TJL8_NEPGR|nr:hypothetical protein Nepgr_032229 [Nepenthes gracilis]